MAQQYQSQAGAAQGASQDAGQSDVNSNKKDDDVIDADFTDKAN